MEEENTFEYVQRTMLLRSIYVLIMPVMLLFAALACGTLVSDTATYTCPTSVPQPTATVLFGTPTPFPLPTLPPPTPFTISPPQDFYVGDAVFVGQLGAALRLRFRLQNVQAQQTLITWQLEIVNLGTTDYETIPVALMSITRITTSNGEQSGTWGTSDTAMQAAGFTSENYDPLIPGEIRIYNLAASIPSGNASQFTYLLDGDGGNRINLDEPDQSLLFG